MLAVLVFIVAMAVIGLGYLALIMGRPMRLHFTLRSVKVEIDPPSKTELPTAGSQPDSHSTGRADPPDGAEVLPVARY